MKLSNAPENLVEMGGGVVSTSEFRIRNNAKAFGILSSGLYANKIRAIIRELSCNAYDSHVAAGKKDAPFDLHLPTRLQPHFSVRDYGVGLDHNEVTDIYTTYFESTKANSNDFIGALGLGSKSPFSYTDNFTVVAIKNATKRVYSAFINEQGVPSVALMAETPTTEVNGVEVRFAVDKDFMQFESEARQVFKYFSVKPNLTGNEIDWAQLDYETTDITPGVHLRRLSGGYYDERINYAIMGNVAYPIQLPEDKEKLIKNTHIANAGFDIHFAIGDVEPQASREGLQYTPATIAAINKRYAEIESQLLAKFSDVIEKVPDDWLRIEALYEKARIPLWTSIATQYAKKHYSHLGACAGDIWNGIRLDATFLEQYNIAFKAFRTQPNYSYRAGAAKKSAHDEHTTRLEIHICGYHRYNDTLFVVDPEATDKYGRIKAHFRSNVETDSYVVYLYPKDKTKPFLIDDFFTAIKSPSDEQKLTMADIKSVQRDYNKEEADQVHIARLKQNDTGRRDRGYYVWDQIPNTKPSKLSKKDTYYYVYMKNFDTFDESNLPIDIKKRLFEFEYAFSHLGKLNVYGVRASALKEVEKLPNWKPFVSGVNDIAKSVSVSDFYNIALDIAHHAYNSYNDTNFTKRITSPNSKFSNFVKKLSSSALGRGNYDAFAAYLKKNVPSVDADNIMKQAQADVKDLIDTYPLLSFLRVIPGNYEYVADYINMIDSKGV